MSSDLESFGSVTRAALGTLLLFAAANGAGGLLVGRLGTPVWQGVAAASMRTAVGLNLVGLVGVVLGQAGWLAGQRSVALLLGLSLLNVPRMWRARSKLRLAQIRRWGAAMGSVPRAGWLAGAAAAVTLGPALCYPTGWDELVYHGELPRRWLAAGRPAFYFDLPYSGFPSLGEMLFWLVAPIEGAIAPRLVVWCCWMTGLVLLYHVLRRCLSCSSAIVLTLAFAANETLLAISANCFVESLVLMNAAALFFAMGHPYRRDARGPRRAPPAILGVLAGGAAAVKLTGGALLLLPGLWHLGAARQGPSRRIAAARSLAVYAAVAVAVGGPFYLRTWRATGNPFYPYLGAWFATDGARLAMSQYHHAIGGENFGMRSVAALVMGPALLANNTDLYDGSFGWQQGVLLALAAVAAWAARRRRWRRIVLWPAVAFVWLYGFWYFTSQQARFAIPAVLALVMLAGVGRQRLRGVRRRAALAALAATALFSLPWPTAGYYLGSWLTALGAMSRTSYVDEGTSFNYLPLVRALHEHTPDDACVMLLFEHRGLYLPRRHRIGTPFFQEEGFTLPERFADATAVMEMLRRHGVTHLVVAKGPIGPDRSAGWLERLPPLFRGLEECAQQGRLQVLWESERYLLLVVNADLSNSPRSP